MPPLISAVIPVFNEVDSLAPFARELSAALDALNPAGGKVDHDGGGGKRNAHSYEYYDRDTGVSVYAAPSVKPGFFLYFDPIDTLSPSVQERWKNPAERDAMVESAIDGAKKQLASTARASSVR